MRSDADLWYTSCDKGVALCDWLKFPELGLANPCRVLEGQSELSKVVSSASDDDQSRACDLAVFVFVGLSGLSAVEECSRRRQGLLDDLTQLESSRAKTIRKRVEVDWT